MAAHVYTTDSAPRLQPALTPALSQLRKSSVTVVTFCTPNFWWGAYFLLASLRRAKMDCQLVIYHFGDFLQSQIELLEQFGGVLFRPLPIASNENWRIVFKPRSMLESFKEFATDYHVWIDADCALLGELDEKITAHPFIPDGGSFSVRVREEIETKEIYRSHLQPGDVGPIPREVLKQWAQDVGESPVPRFQTQYNTNFMSFHRLHQPLIQEWLDLCIKVLPAHIKEFHTNSGLTPAYRTTDESVLTALLSFKEVIPVISPYTLNLSKSLYLIHFGMSPKPWEGFRFDYKYQHGELLKLIRWIREKNHRLPEKIPVHLRAALFPFFCLVGLVPYGVQRLKYWVKARLYS